MKNVTINDLLDQIDGYEFDSILFSGYYPGSVRMETTVFPDSIVINFIYRNHKNENFVYKTLKEAVTAYVNEKP
jgi:hypothetical protein